MEHESRGSSDDSNLQILFVGLQHWGRDTSSWKLQWRTKKIQNHSRGLLHRFLRILQLPPFLPRRPSSIISGLQAVHRRPRSLQQYSTEPLEQATADYSWGKFIFRGTLRFFGTLLPSFSNEGRCLLWQFDLVGLDLCLFVSVSGSNQVLLRVEAEYVRSARLGR